MNISLSGNNPVFLGGHFTRVELLEAIGLGGFRCYPRVICRVDTCFCHGPIWLICTARFVLSSLNISPVGTNFETCREQVGYLHFALLRRARKFD